MTKILRNQPATLQVAVSTNEQNLRPPVQMSHYSGYTSTQNHFRDLDLTRSVAAHNHKSEAGIVAKQVT